MNRDLLIFSKKRSENINNENIANYFYYQSTTLQFSASSMNISINAIKFFYGKILKKYFIYDITRPKKDKILPVVFNKKEIKAITSILSNLKHTLLLNISYSGGLRVSEAVSLKVADIDIERKMIHIRQSKGRKDRYTIISKVAISLFQEYRLLYKPDIWLFPGQKPCEHISVRTAEKVFKKLLKKQV